MKFTSTILLILIFFVTSLLLFSCKKKKTTPSLLLIHLKKIEILLTHGTHHFAEQILPKSLHETYHSIK
jgi:hypothetical protein